MIDMVAVLPSLAKKWKLVPVYWMKPRLLLEFINWRSVAVVVD